MSGDVYLSIDMQLFEERRIVPSWTLRAALKTASGGGYEIDRYYDCPGYFFDTYFGKTFQIASAVIQIFPVADSYVGKRTTAGKMMRFSMEF